MACAGIGASRYAVGRCHSICAVLSTAVADRWRRYPGGLVALRVADVVREPRESASPCGGVSQNLPKQ